MQKHLKMDYDVELCALGTGMIFFNPFTFLIYS
jgi:hypothetical protein